MARKDEETEELKAHGVLGGLAVEDVPREEEPTWKAEDGE